MKPRNIALPFHVLLACILVLAVACGVKAPPVPADYKPPAAVEDLQYTIEENGVVVLRWSLPDKRAQETGRPERVKVFRSRESLEEAACDDCPLNYRLLREVPLGKDNQVFREGLEKGYRYHYKLVVVDDADGESGDSNVVSFEYE